MRHPTHRAMERTFHVTGLDCASCAQTLEQGVARLPGVQACQVQFASGTLRVVGDVSLAQLQARVRELGYDLAAPAEGLATASAAPTGWPRFMWQHRDTRLALLGLVLIIPGVILEELLRIDHPIITTLALGAWLTAGFPIVRSAWRALRINREVNINVLMTIASAGAIVIGAFTEAGMVMVLFAIGEALERYTGERARQAIRSLAKLAPEHARLLRPHPGSALAPGEVAVTALRPGDVILVRPGERIPVDGQVLSGMSAVNQAPITGESRPIDKTPGSEVFAGSINGEGALEVEVTRLASDTVLSRLIQLVQEAQERRAAAQRFIDRFARVYTPAVVALAGLVAVVPPLLFGQPFVDPVTPSAGWLYRGLALLVVACPCALVISTPVSIISALSNAARHGVLIKGGAYLEALNRIRAVAFDKTGTLTVGDPDLLDLVPLSPRVDRSAALTLIAALESGSEHPLARVFIRRAAEAGLALPAVDAFTAVRGQGVEGLIAGRRYRFGTPEWAGALCPTLPPVLPPERAACLTVSVLCDEQGPLALASLGDRLRPEAAAVIADLPAHGIIHTVLLSGDRHETAREFGLAAGVQESRGRLAPEAKGAHLADLAARYGPTLMLGDGINDTPALAAADVGVAMGTKGTDAALATAGAVLLHDDLRRLPLLLAIARRTRTLIRQNIALAVGLKLAVFGLSLAGYATLWLAVLADTGASVLVVANGLRALGDPPLPLRPAGSRPGANASPRS